MIINESTKLEGYVTGIGKIKADGTEEFEWLEHPKHNRIVSTGLDHLLCFNGLATGYFTATADTYQYYPALWLGRISPDNHGDAGNHYGALTFCKIGTGKKETEFTDTDLQTPVGGLSSTLRTGEPFCGTKVNGPGDYVIRVSHTSNTVSEQCKIWEVGLFGQYNNDNTIVNPMFARVKLDKGIELLAGEQLVFTYDLHITYTDIEPVEDENFCDLLDSVGDPLKYSRKIFFEYTKNSGKYRDELKRDLYITYDGLEKNYSSMGTLNTKYFFRLPPYFYNSIGSYGDYDSTGYSTITQEFTVQDVNLSKARAEALANNYTFDVLDYEGVGNKDKHRDITICMGLYNPNMEDPTDSTDIQFLRIRGMNYRFGYYTEDPETQEKIWNPQSLRKWANQTMTFTIRTRYVTEDTLDMDGNDPEQEPEP